MNARPLRLVSGRDRSGAGGFSLIEIMVVVGILGLVITMGAPAIRSVLRRDPMTQAVVDVTDACRAARAQAILTGNPTPLRFYPLEHRMEVSESTQKTAESPDGKPPPPRPGYLSAKGFSAQISDRVGLKLVYVNFVDCTRMDLATVYFQPNGTCDEFTLVLHADTGEAKQITLDIVTSLPKVTTIQ